MKALGARLGKSRGSRGRVLSAPLVALALLGAADTAAARVTTAKPTYTVAKEQNVVIPMTDGTKLVADIYRPVPKKGQKANQRFPCLFEMTPYRKELRAKEAAGFFPQRGFAYAEVDARGTGGSGGQYNGVFLPAEQKDGYDAIEWLATKYKYCTAKVGMWGGSYSGINQYLIATSPKGTPPHLRTIAPQRALSDLYRDIVYTGGILTGSFGLLWAGGTTGYNAVGADPTTGPAPDMALTAVLDHATNDPMFTTYLNAPFDGPLYRNSSVIYRMRKLNLPVFHLEGFYDAFTRGQTQAIGEALRLERRGVIKGPNYAVIGPWNHGDTHFLAHPPYDRRIYEWYARWLDKGPRPKWFSEKRVTYCEMLAARNGRCNWRHTDVWPPDVDYDAYYLTAGGGLERKKPRGTGAVGSWVYNPSAGTGEDGFSKWDNAAGVPQRDPNQTDDEAKGRTFSTPPLKHDLAIGGPIDLSLVASSTPLSGSDPGLPLNTLASSFGMPGAFQFIPGYHDTDFVVKLSDVGPRGTSTLIQSGFLRASHRLLDPKRTKRVEGRITQPVPFHVAGKLAPPKPGQRYRYEIEIWPTAKRFQKGHGLRIALYSADTANHLTLLKPATNTAYAGSYLLLPVATR
jgi:putative CocE/NonD family hydrolase